MKTVATIALAATLGFATLAGSAKPADAHDRGVALGLGIFGLTMGAIAAQRYYQPRYYGPYYEPRRPRPYYGHGPYYGRESSRIAWCDRKYKSYNPRTRHYKGYDGRWHYC